MSSSNCANGALRIGRLPTLLTQHCLPTSKTAIATFCHQILGEIVRPHRRPGRKRPSSPAEPNGRVASPTQSEPGMIVRRKNHWRTPMAAKLRKPAAVAHASRKCGCSNLKPHETSRPHPQWQRRRRQKFLRRQLRPVPQRQGIAHIAIDSDNENSTLKRFHPDTWFLDLANRRELDGIFNALEKANLVVMDCRAASTDLFIDYFTEIDLSSVLSNSARSSRSSCR